MQLSKPIKDFEARNLNPLLLAFMGDSVFQNHVRERILLRDPDRMPHELHLEAIRYVKAQSQSDIIESIGGMLTEDEFYIYKRGRNMKSGTIPKNADVLDYRRATGFESLIGYLYLTGREARLGEILEASYRLIEGKEVRK